MIWIRRQRGSRSSSIVPAALRLSLLRNAPPFRDFLGDLEEHKTNIFLVDEKETHDYSCTLLAALFSKYLRADICDLEIPGTPRSAVD